MNRTLIKDACEGKGAGEEILVQGWVRTRRDSRTFSFLEINDGTCLRNIQAIVDRPRHAEVSPATTGSSVSVTGKLVPSRGRGQAFEIVVDTLEIVGGADATYPLQKKGHSPEYLREIAHLRPRSNLFGSVFRVRSRLALAIHRFFEERGFHHIHTPIITSSDCEGAGELFRVTAGGSRETNGREFFGQPAYLTVSGQLAAEAFACALSKVYTFGPTFRAENSNTSRHASEFWMLEPEMAFCDLQGNMTMAEDCIKYLLGDLMDRCPDELDLFNRFVDKKLVERIRFVIERSFRHISHGEAVRLLLQSGRRFEHPVEQGMNLRSEHERYLTEEYFRQPVTVHDYPRGIKPFYMRVNDDGETVAAMDVLVPGIGEIVGGSQREERRDILLERLREQGLDPEHYRWYLDLRQYGTVPHSGFGLGFERLIMFATGISNIRDVIPFARTPGSAEF